MDAEQAIHNFWSSFGVPAYDDNSVPDTAQLPYITYSVSYDSIDNDVSLSASLWEQTTSWEWLSKKAAEISEYISRSGKILLTDNGSVWVRRGHPFYQRVGNEDKNIKRIMFSVNIEYFQKN